MKFYSNQIANIIDSINKGRINAVLFYGPDHGLIEHSTHQIANSLKLEKHNISYSDASFDIIKHTLNNISLFGNREVVCIKDVPATIDAKFKELLSQTHHHIPILTSAELPPSSGLRKIFELENNLAAVPCYHDNEESVERLVKTHIAKSGKEITRDAIRFLSTYLHGDRYIIMNELEKLLCYANHRPEITIDDVVEVISSSTTAEPDKLCLYFLEGNTKEYSIELDKILAEQISPVWVIRAVIRYYINLYITLTKMADGMSVNDAVSSLSPPIFFKYVSSFKNIASNTDMPKLMKCLTVLYNAEKELKSSTVIPKQICENAFFHCNLRG